MTSYEITNFRPKSKPVKKKVKSERAKKNIRDAKIIVGSALVVGLLPLPYICLAALLTKMWIQGQTPEGRAKTRARIESIKAGLHDGWHKPIAPASFMRAWGPKNYRCK